MYTFVYYIKDFFARPKISRQVNLYPERDAGELYSMCNEMKFLRATNGKTYWYCFIKDIKNLKPVRDILARNGIRGRLHFSQYYYDMHPCIRANAASVANNSFVKYMDMYATAMANREQNIFNITNQNTK